MKITLAHSPDADDAFMFYGLATGKIDTEGMEITHELRDIQTLNEWAHRGKYEITALSFHAYPDVQDKYRPLTTGGSFGEKNYGPIVVRPSGDFLKKHRFSERSEREGGQGGKTPSSGRRQTAATVSENLPLEGATRAPIIDRWPSHSIVGVPGTKTTAFLLLKLWRPDVKYAVLPFDQIPKAVADGKVNEGLLIHEGQLFFEEFGLEEVVDFGRWWFNRHHLPLPLGGNMVRRDLPPTLQKKIAMWLRQSFEYSLAHREVALDYAMRFARNLPREKADRFVGMYVNERTLDMGEEGKKAVGLLLDLGYKSGIISKQAKLDWVAL